MTSLERATIHELAARFASGDRSAFDPLFVALWPVVRSFAGRTLPPTDADDAAQEALVKVFARIAEFDTARDATAWALTIVSFEILTHRRRRSRRREVAEVPEGARAHAPSPEDEAHARELRDELEAYLGRVSELDRAAIRAALLGEPAPRETQRKRRWRALDRLRRYWSTNHE